MFKTFTRNRRNIRCELSGGRNFATVSLKYFSPNQARYMAKRTWSRNEFLHLFTIDNGAIVAFVELRIRGTRRIRGLKSYPVRRLSCAFAAGHLPEWSADGRRSTTFSAFISSFSQTTTPHDTTDQWLGGVQLIIYYYFRQSRRRRTAVTTCKVRARVVCAATRGAVVVRDEMQHYRVAPTNYDGLWPGRREYWSIFDDGARTRAVRSVTFSPRTRHPKRSRATSHKIHSPVRSSTWRNITHTHTHAR